MSNTYTQTVDPILYNEITGKLIYYPNWETAQNKRSEGYSSAKLITIYANQEPIKKIIVTYASDIFILERNQTNE